MNSNYEKEGRMAVLAAERQQLELKKLQSDAGLLSERDVTLTIERMDWMYPNPVNEQKEREEEYLLGKPIDDRKSHLNTLDDSNAGSLFLKSMTETNNDTLRKLREDPLMIIRQAELRHRKALDENPFRNLDKAGPTSTHSRVAKRRKKDSRDARPHSPSEADTNRKSRHDRHSSESDRRGYRDKGDKDRREKSRHEVDDSLEMRDASSHTQKGTHQGKREQQKHRVKHRRRSLSSESESMRRSRCEKPPRRRSDFDGESPGRRLHYDSDGRHSQVEEQRAPSLLNTPQQSATDGDLTTSPSKKPKQDSLNGTRGSKSSPSSASSLPPTSFALGPPPSMTEKRIQEGHLNKAVATARTGSSRRLSTHPSLVMEAPEPKEGRSDQHSAAEQLKQMLEDGQRHEQEKDQRLADVERKERLLSAVDEHLRTTKGGRGVIASVNKKAYLESSLSMADRLKRRAATRSRTLESTLER